MADESGFAYHFRDSSLESHVYSYYLKSSELAEHVHNKLKKEYSYTIHDAKVEIVREVRFDIRLVLYSWRIAINHGNRSNNSLRLVALEAVDPGNEGIDSVRLRTGKILGGFVSRAEWEFNSRKDGRLLPADQQPGNKSMMALQDGIKKVLAEIDAILEVDGSKDQEFSEPESDQDDESGEIGGTMQQKASKIRMHPTTTINPKMSIDASDEKAPKRSARPWSLQEDVKLLDVIGKIPNALPKQKAAELNSRMKRIRETQGVPQEPPRSVDAINQRCKTFVNMRSTTASIEEPASSGSSAYFCNLEAWKQQ